MSVPASFHSGLAQLHADLLATTNQNDQTDKRFLDGGQCAIINPFLEIARRQNSSNPIIQAIPEKATVHHTKVAAIAWVGQLIAVYFPVD